MSRSNCDILIQGGGPVGLACASWVLQKFPDARLTLLDRNPLDDADLAAKLEAVAAALEKCAVGLEAGA